MTSIYKSEASRRAVEERYRQFLNHWPIPNRQLRLQTRQGETFVVASGDERAPALLLLHGSGANSASWMGDVAAWAEHFCVYAIDMIGEPGFSAASRPPLASEAHALWLDDVLDALSLKRVSITGISLGGWLALDYATRRPTRVDALALLCPGGVGKQKNFLLKALPLLFLGAWGRRKMFELVFGRRSSAPSPEAQAFGDFISLIFAHFRPRRDKLPVFSDGALEKLTMPVLVILGGKDVLLDSQDSRRRLAKTVPHAEVDFLPDAGHVLLGHTARILSFLLRAGKSSDDVRQAS